MRITIDLDHDGAPAAAVPVVETTSIKGSGSPSLLEPEARDAGGCRRPRTDPGPSAATVAGGETPGALGTAFDAGASKLSAQRTPFHVDTFDGLFGTAARGRSADAGARRS